MSKKFKRENCSSVVRATIKDAHGNKVVLAGKHAFEWQIILQETGKVIVYTFPNRVSAMKEWNRKYKGKN